MAFVAIPDAWKVTLVGQSGASLRPWAMTFGVKDTDTHNLARAVDVSQGFLSWWEAQLQALVSTNDTLVSIDVLDAADPTGVSLHRVTGLPENGSHSGDPAGGQVAAITTFLTGARGRSNRGRSFLPGITASFINAGDGTSLDSDAQASIQAAYVALTAAIDAKASGAVHAILSKKDVEAKPVLAYLTRRYLGTQKRRVRA
jgi:hypothetical protein